MRVYAPPIAAKMPMPPSPAVRSKDAAQTSFGTLLQSERDAAARDAAAKPRTNPAAGTPKAHQPSRKAERFETSERSAVTSTSAETADARRAHSLQGNTTAPDQTADPDAESANTPADSGVATATPLETASTSGDTAAIRITGTTAGTDPVPDADPTATASLDGNAQMGSAPDLVPGSASGSGPGSAPSLATNSADASAALIPGMHGVPGSNLQAEPAALLAETKIASRSDASVVKSGPGAGPEIPSTVHGAVGKGGVHVPATLLPTGQAQSPALETAASLQALSPNPQAGTGAKVATPWAKSMIGGRLNTAASASPLGAPPAVADALLAPPSGGSAVAPVGTLGGDPGATSGSTDAGTSTLGKGAASNATAAQLPAVLPPMPSAAALGQVAPTAAPSTAGSQPGGDPTGSTFSKADAGGASPGDVAAHAQSAGGVPETSSLGSARLLQTLSRSEMQIKVNSEDFGHVTIHTAYGRDAISAQITLGNAQLGSALSAHIPALEQKLQQSLAGNGDLRASVTVNTQTSGGNDRSHNGGQAGQQPSQGRASWASNATLASDVAPSLLSSANAPASSLGGSGGRLDIRI